ncbi:hypothetical protein D3C78_1353790 [compost metagenome]
MAGHEEVTHRFGIVIFQHITHGEEVIQRFGHFLAIDHHHTGVHPVINVLAAVCASRLGNFVFMMWEHQVRTATVDVEMVT